MFDSMKNRARKLPFYPHARSVYHRLRRAPRHRLQDLTTQEGYSLKRLGTEYGGWTFVDDGNLFGSTIISAGLGEDASFDVEFARTYNARVVIVDPTPRAIEHFDNIIARLGNQQTRDYVGGGKQPAEAYDLRGLSLANFTLVPKALWNATTTLKFFEPRDPKDVSHSIINYQHGYTQDTSHLEVEATTIEDLLQETGLESDDFALVKLDIEGAEIEVICDFLDKKIRPRQILIEFDELTEPSPEAFQRVDYLDAKLNSHGYKCIHTDGHADFLYVRSD
ncbi:hypothetical protein C6A85_000000111655 [Mycobacterium sp. ITM-2017-0098]|nr:hypothetical protein C6A85_000000111655 [Mycobacterium sp. ITM-2017-0098]